MMTRCRRRGSSRLWFALWAVTGVGCAAYGSKFECIEQQLVVGKPAAALALIDKDAPAGRDRLLHHLERAMLLRMDGQLTESNREFEAAKRTVDAVAALSLREQGTALLVNDTTTSYGGAAFEQVMINLYSALNYLELGDRDAARVEALQVDLRLRELADADAESIFRNDPFARYLSGMIFEDGAEWSDAMIAYRKAYEAYREHGRRYSLAVPEALEEDLLRSAARLGLNDELDRLEAEFGKRQWPELYGGPDRGELVVFFHNGLVPVKREQRITVPAVGKGRLVSIAVPTYQVRPPGARAVRVEVARQELASEVVENLGGMAVADLEAHMGAIMARTAARVVAKFAASEAAGKKNELAGVLVNLAGVLSERADTRSWLTLPQDIQMARVSLPPGLYDVELEIVGPGGAVVDRRALRGIEVRRGQRVYRSLHWVSLRSIARR